MKDANFVIRQGPERKLILYTSHNHFIFGLFNDVKIAMRGLKTRHLIFMVEAGDHDFVLD